jgi:NADPH2:quinone reductase
MKAIRIYETGGPEVMRLEEIERPQPRKGEVLIKVAAAGVNYADLAQRQGTYLTRTRTPTILGSEVAGTVEALGPEVSAPAVGTRVVAFANGGYAEYTTARADWVFAIPPTLAFTQAAALPVQGITAYQLLQESARLQSGESVLIHAAAGGVGTFAVQLAKLLGAGTVLGTASSEEKLAYVRQLGADVVINYRSSDWVEQVKSATGGLGADIILEMVGGEIAAQNLRCLAPFGRMVVYGAASGQVTQFSGIQLMYRNQALIGYWLSAWLSRPERVALALQELTRYVDSGALKVLVGQIFSLEQAAQAHQAIAERRTTGKVILTVEPL